MNWSSWRSKEVFLGLKADPWIPNGRWSIGQLGYVLQKNEVKKKKELKTRNKMEVDEATPGLQPSGNETGGGFFYLCEVEERQEARVEVQGPKSRVIRVESEETQDYASETLAISQEEVDEIGFVPSA